MLSSRAKYATRALLELALHPNEAVHIQEIAERQNISVKFLEQILLALKRAGYVQSRKGPGGGYSLAKPARNITLGAVVRTMDGPIAPISCVSATGYMECGCPEPETCGLRSVWQQARDALAAVLDKTTFADIVERHRNGTTERGHILDYVI